MPTAISARPHQTKGRLWYSLQGAIQEHLQLGLGDVLDDEPLVRSLAEGRAALAPLGVPLCRHAQASDVAVTNAEAVVRVVTRDGKNIEPLHVTLRAHGETNLAESGGETLEPSVCTPENSPTT